MNMLQHVSNIKYSDKELTYTLVIQPKCIKGNLSCWKRKINLDNLELNCRIQTNNVTWYFLPPMDTFNLDITSALPTFEAFEVNCFVPPMTYHCTQWLNGCHEPPTPMILRSVEVIMHSPVVDWDVAYMLNRCTELVLFHRIAWSYMLQSVNVLKNCITLLWTCCNMFQI